MKSTLIRGARLFALALAIVACNSDRLTAPGVIVGGESAALAVAPPPSIRINEINYDNTGTDAGERVEISGPAGASIAGWKLVPYNGANGMQYTPAPTLAGAIPATCGARGVVFVGITGIQNGSPDGIALVNNLGEVVEFLSYEGTFTAVDGPAAGKVSTDIGIAQTGDATLDPIGSSLQRDDTGAWQRTKVSSFGSCNAAITIASVSVAPSPAVVTIGNTTTIAGTARDGANQLVGSVPFAWTSSNTEVATVSDAGVVTGVALGTATVTATAPGGLAASTNVSVATPPGSDAHIRVSEFHYNNAGTDVDEKIELEGDFGGSLAGWTIVLYNGTNGAAPMYGTIALSGSFGNACGGSRGVLTFAATNMQNGPRDGLALVNPTGQVVEFLSYGGSFAAADGPAAGMTATDVGVHQGNDPPAGRSLQRAGNGTWFGPYTHTFDACNDPEPPPPITGVFIIGRTPPEDAPLPVGYQDQLFASLRDENTGATVPTTITWTSETPAIATIDDRGVVTAHAVGSAVLRATAANGLSSTTTLLTEAVTLGDPSLYRNALAFGTPTDANSLDDVRLSRPQYESSYNMSRGTPNWVAYHLSKAVRGDLPGYRCNCFTVDAAVTPLGDPGISTADYTGSGYDRGHMVRSNDRELARGDQATTYLMSNIVPQAPTQNQGRWADLETYLQTVADGPTVPEVYIFAGPRGDAGKIASGKAVIPTHTWKVAVVLRAGVTPSQVTSASDIVDLIAVDMPNVAMPDDGDWQQFKTTVDAIEAATGYDLLSALPAPLEAILESNDRAPTAAFTGSITGVEGGAITFDASGSSDPDVGDFLTYSWTFTNGLTASSVNPTVIFTDNGTYTATLTVSDKYGATSEATKTITISNAAPAVAAFAGGSILRGETYGASGSFSDPGADTHTSTVNYGDGTGTNPLTLSGSSFVLSHAYATAGTFTVTITVTDDDGASTSRTATVTVISATAAIAALQAQVAGLETAGTLSKGEANALDASLRNALKSLEGDNLSAVNGQIGAFTNKVEAMRESGRLSATTAASLIDYANRILASIG